MDRFFFWGGGGDSSVIPFEWIELDSIRFTRFITIHSDYDISEKDNKPPERCGCARINTPSSHPHTHPDGLTSIIHRQLSQQIYSHWLLIPSGWIKCNNSSFSRKRNGYNYVSS